MTRWSSTLVPLAAAIALACGGCKPAPTVAPSGASAALVGDIHGERRFTARLRIFDATGTERTLPDVLDELAAADVVFFGETHTDETTHQLEHAVFTGLAQRRAGKVTLSMEMFQRDAQPVLDDYLAGKIDEAELMKRGEPWPNYRTGYRALVEAAKAAGARVIAANTPRSVLRLVGGRDRAAYDEARAEHPDLLPKEMHPPSEAYTQRVARALRGHGPGMGGGDAMWSVQNFWDNTMGDSVALARAADPDRTVVHFAGGFHIAEHDGTVAQCAKRRPDDAIKTIMAVPTHDLAAVEPNPEHGDFVAYVRADAQGPNGGELSVTVPGQLSWRLWLPEHAIGDARVPLLVFLPGREERVDDALLRWRYALHGEAAIAVVEPPNREESEIGWLRRRWYFPGSFGGDTAFAAAGLSRLIGYARRNLPVDPARVAVVGEQSGGAVALWAALYGDDLDVPVVALSPETPHELRTATVPDERSAVTRLTIVYDGAEPDGLGEVVEGLSAAGITTKPLSLTGPAPAMGRKRIAAVAEALGLQPREIDATHPEVLVAGGLEPHGVVWARLLATRWESDGRATELVDSSQSPAAYPLGAGVPHASVWIADALADTPLPRPEASFGGGTVIVIPSGMPKRVYEAWTATVDKAKEKRGRFAPLHLVTEGKDELAPAVAAIKEQGWSTVLVVPAVFAAHTSLMRRLRAELADVPEDMTVQWLPGFGAAIAAAPPAASGGEDESADGR